MHARVNPYVRVIVNGQEKIKTSVQWLDTSPVFEVPGEVVVLDRNDVFIRVEVKDKRNVHDDDTLGSWTANLSDIFKHQEENEGWWQLTREDKPVGQIRFSAEWKPVVMTGLTEGLGGHGYEGKFILRACFILFPHLTWMHSRSYRCCALYILASKRPAQRGKCHGWQVGSVCACPLRSTNTRTHGRGR